MGQRDAQYPLSGEIELDDGFFTVDSEEYDANAPRRRGRGSEAKARVLVMAESKEVSHPTRRDVTRSVGYVKMQVIPNLRAETIDEVVMDSMEQESQLITDGSTSYTHFSDMVDEHRAQVISPREVGKVLPWVHIVISNAKRQLLDVFHSVDVEFLQSYLNEYCYKFNRRHCDCFERLMYASVMYKNTFKHRTYVKNVA